MFIYIMSVPVPQHQQQASEAWSQNKSPVQLIHLKHLYDG